MPRFPNPWRGLGGLPRGVWALSAATLVNRMGTMALPFLVLYLTRSLAIPADRAALALVAFGTGSLLVSPLAGRLCDRVGAARVMVGSLLLTGVLLLLFPLVRGLPALLATAFLWAAVAEAFRPAALVALAELTHPEERRAANALFRLAINLGMSVGPAAGGLLATVSFPALFVVDGITSLAAAVVLAALLRMPARAPVSAAAAHALAPAGVLRDRRTLAFLVACTLLGAVFFQHIGAMPLYLVNDLGLTEAHFGFLFAVNTVLIVLFEVPLNVATAHWPHRTSLVLGALLCAAGFGALGLATGLWTAAATVVVWTAGEMILFPAMAAYMADVAPAERRGEYMGAYNMSFAVAFALAPWGGTVVLERFGGGVLWGAVAACGVLATLVIARVVAITPSAPSMPPAPAGEEVRVVAA